MRKKIFFAMLLVLCGLPASRAFAADFPANASKLLKGQAVDADVAKPAVSLLREDDEPAAKDCSGSPVKYKADTAIMLQGFHWYADSYWPAGKKGWYAEMARKAPEMGRAGIKIVWFPPPSVGSYYPSQLYNLNSQWGTEEQLRDAIDAMHKAGILVLADAVLNHRNGTKDWADFTRPTWPTTVITKDDEWPGPGKSENYDEGEAEHGCRDLDHRNEIVQRGYKNYLKWLRCNIGFDGFRYDKVKGYPGKYTAMYNAYAKPVISVGEFFDGNRQTLMDWIDSTGKGDAASMAFDFSIKYQLQRAIESDDYSSLDGGITAWWSGKSVSFVENHDTAPRDPDFIANAPESYKRNTMAASAYILTHPGIPCIFWPHYYDMGQSYHDQIQALLEIRKQAGIGTSSKVEVLRAEKGLYVAIVNNNLALKLGSSWNWNPPQEWKLIRSGDNYAIWTNAKKKK
ncbi:MAG: alpha-amylase [Elusimicrobia bacterium]|nr:alpha-amylase [Elusimicrobiota bacterium]